MNVRTFLHLAIALTLLSIACDAGAVCAMAGMGGDCCCPMPDRGTPCTDVTGGGDVSGASELAAIIDLGQFFAQAVLCATQEILPPRALEPGRGGPLGPTSETRSTPLYLSHCSYLC